MEKKNQIVILIKSKKKDNSEECDPHFRTNTFPLKLIDRTKLITFPVIQSFLADEREVIR